MARLYLMVKRKGAKSYQGAIPAKKGMTAAKLRTALKGRVNSNYSVKIATATQLKSYIKRLAGSRKKARKKTRKTTKRKTRRKVVRKKRR